MQWPIENVTHAALQLIGIGAEIEVIAPVALREQLHLLANQCAALNA